MSKLNEVENNLLQALQDDARLGGQTNFERIVNQSSHQYLKAQILDILKKQREKCAKGAVARHDGCDWIADKESIINAKLF